MTRRRSRGPPSSPSSPIARQTHGRFWHKAARTPGGEHDLAALALRRLAQLQLLRRDGDAVVARPALARYTLSAPQTAATPAPQQQDLL